MPDREPPFLQDLPMQEMINFFRGKVNVPTERYDDISEEAHKKAFVVAGVTKGEMLNQFRSAVDDAITNGESLEDFRKKFDAASANWDYRGGRDWRSWIIYDTNLRKAYAEGVERRMQDPALRKAMPYAMYLHGTSKVPRPEHLSYDRKILKIDDPWWQAHNPPIGYGCSCIKRYMTPNELPTLYKLKEFAQANSPALISLIGQHALQSVLTRSTTTINDVITETAPVREGVKVQQGVKTAAGVHTVTGEVIKQPRKSKTQMGAARVGQIYNQDVLFSGELLHQVERADIRKSHSLMSLITEHGEVPRLEHMPDQLTNKILTELDITAHHNLGALVPSPLAETRIEPPFSQLDELLKYADLKRKQHPIPTVARNLDNLARGGFNIHDLEQAVAATNGLVPQSVLSVLFEVDNTLSPHEAFKLVEGSLLDLEAKSNYYSNLKDYLLTSEKLQYASGDIFIIKTSSGSKRAYRMAKGKRIPMPIATAEELVSKGLRADRILGIPPSLVPSVKPQQHLSIEMIKLLKFLTSAKGIRFSPPNKLKLTSSKGIQSGTYNESRIWY